MATDPQPYILGTDDHELDRLGLQQRVWAEETEGWLDALELQPGARVLDAGCGPGWVTERILPRVGGEGRVLAMDESRRWIEHLEGRIAAEGWRTVEPRRARLEDFSEVEAFDAVFVRWVLSFPPDPAALLERLARSLVLGGRLIAIDYNHEGVSLFPRSRGFDAVVEATRALYVSRGGDAFVAGRFPKLFREAGLELERLKPHAIAGGPGSPAFAWADSFWPYHCHQMEAAGVLSASDKQLFLEEWAVRREDPDTIFFSPLVVSALGRRSNE
ncbi:MAG: methyltransferase domain-containing protein [Planctomycetota bacterium]